MIPTAADRQMWAEDAWAWFNAYRAAGFDEEQALCLLTAVMGRASGNVAGNSPETAEFMERMSRFVEGQIE